MMLEVARVTPSMLWLRRYTTDVSESTNMTFKVTVASSAAVHDCQQRCHASSVATS
jgi:hypothetical protein